MFKGRIARVVGSGVVIGALLVGASACSKKSDDVQKAIDKELSEEVGGSVKTGGDVPESWPKEIPFPDGYKVLASADLSDEDITSISVNVSVSMSPDDLVDFYKDALSSWDVIVDEGDDDGEDGLISLSFDRDSESVNLSIEAKDGGKKSEYMVNYGKF